MAMMGMIVIMLPMFFLAMYEKDGQPLEVVLKHFIDARFIRPKVRPYRTANYYALLIRQYETKKEVERIVRNAEERGKAQGKAA